MKQKIFTHKRRYINTAIMLLLICMLAVSVFGCSNKTDAKATESKTYERGVSITNEADAMGFDVFEPAKFQPNAPQSSALLILEPQSQKLIKDATIDIETTEFDKFMPKLNEKIVEAGGYIRQSDETGSSYEDSRLKSAYIVACIPAEQLDAFLNNACALGNVTNQSTSVQDITMQYTDVESRIAVLTTEVETLRGILEMATTTEDMLTIQREIFNIIEELEAYTAQINSYERNIRYSTVSLHIQEVKQVTPPVEEEKGDELSRKFNESLESLGEFFTNLGMTVLTLSPWILTIGGMVTVVLCAIFIPKRLKKKRQTKAK